MTSFGCFSWNLFHYGKSNKLVLIICCLVQSFSPLNAERLASVYLESCPEFFKLFNLKTLHPGAEVKVWKQGWRLDPLLLFCQLLTAGTALAWALEAIKLRKTIDNTQVNLFPQIFYVYYVTQPIISSCTRSPAECGTFIYMQWVQPRIFFQY